MLILSLIHSGSFSGEFKKGVLGSNLHIDCPSLLNAHLDCHLVPDFPYENLVHDAVRGVLLAAELCLLPALIWPFSSWPGTSWLIPSCLEFHLFWVPAWSSGSWQCSLEKVVSKFSFHHARESHQFTKVNWNQSWVWHFIPSFGKLLPVLPKYSKLKCLIQEERWAWGGFGTTKGRQVIK